MTVSCSYQPLIIIGAARSGTNLLRDLLCQGRGLGTWPCDEINYIWRHGNVRHPDDQLPVEAARPEIRSYIRSRFDSMAERTGSQILVEKTCANSLRVDFVDAAVPDAKFVFIVRDGVDAAASAMLRWRAKLDIAYLIRKARFVPLPDLPYYASRYLGNRIHRLASSQKQLAFWGPKFRGFDQYTADAPLDSICARQWESCALMADESLARLDTNRVCHVRYEDLVRTPGEIIRQVLAFAGADADSGEIDVSHVSPDSIGRGPDVLGQTGTQRVKLQLSATLGRFGYA